jgi:hypothetical protein
LFDGIRDSLRKQPNLLDQLDDRHANEFQYIHVWFLTSSTPTAKGSFIRWPTVGALLNDVPHFWNSWFPLSKLAGI